MQSYSIKTAIEALRRNKPYNMGGLYWQLNDVWYKKKHNQHI